MLTTTYKFPKFDLSELTTDPTFYRKQYQPLKPLKTGNIAPEFSLIKGNGTWLKPVDDNLFYGNIALRSVLNHRPLVIAFYSKHWKVSGIKSLRNLNTIQQKIAAKGGSVLIITPDDAASIEKTIWQNSLSLSFYFDDAHTIARKFNIFSDNDPVWNKFSGIDTNVPLLSTYVIAPSGQIVFDHIEQEFTGGFSANDLLAAV